MKGIEIRRLLSAAEHDQAVELQRSYWGDSADNLVPRHMQHSIARYGGHVLGAYDGDKAGRSGLGFHRHRYRCG